jgi:6-phosphogluconolactonase (cycloisomerase 2 family)
MDGNSRLLMGFMPGGSRGLDTYVHMEIKRRMRTRFTWIVAIIVLVAIGFLIACSTKYSSSSNGLVVVPSQGSAVMETFTLNLASGATSQINNVNGPPTPGLPTAVILDPAGKFAYVIMKESAALVPSVTGIGVFPIGSDGKLGAGTTTPFNNTVGGTPVLPVALAIDAAGKFLFVADSANNGAPGTVSVFALSGGTLTEVSGSPFPLPVEPGGSVASASALAVTPTVYPVQFSFCSGHTAPTTENLYVADSTNYVLLNYSVDLSAGGLTLLPFSPATPGIPTGSVPSGVAVDPCNRFVYVANAGPGSNQNTISAYTICSAINLLSQPPCSVADFSLNPVTGSPFPTNSNSPGPIAVDAYGNFLYVVNTGSGNVSGFRINANTGALAVFSGGSVVAGMGANSIAVRSDDSWVFVANTNATSVSQYALSLTTGSLSPVTPISTLDFPSGVAVK